MPTDVWVLVGVFNLIQFMVLLIYFGFVGLVLVLAALVKELIERIKKRLF